MHTLNFKVSLLNVHTTLSSEKMLTVFNWSGFQALGTAEMVTDMITGDSRTIDHKPYSVDGRFC